MVKLEEARKKELREEAAAIWKSALESANKEGADVAAENIAGTAHDGKAEVEFDYLYNKVRALSKGDKSRLGMGISRVLQTKKAKELRRHAARRATLCRQGSLVTVGDINVSGTAVINIANVSAPASVSTSTKPDEKESDVGVGATARPEHARHCGRVSTTENERALLNKDICKVFGTAAAGFLDRTSYIDAEMRRRHKARHRRSSLDEETEWHDTPSYDIYDMAVLIRDNVDIFDDELRHGATPAKQLLEKIVEIRNYLQGHTLLIKPALGYTRTTDDDYHDVFANLHAFVHLTKSDISVRKALIATEERFLNHIGTSLRCQTLEKRFEE